MITEFKTGEHFFVDEMDYLNDLNHGVHIVHIV